MAAPAADDAIDRVLGGRYRLESAIGHGGMSTVYRARDEALGRDVAVKLFHVGNVDVDRQEGELAVLSGLNHHGLVNLFDAGAHVDERGAAHRYLVMALIAGATLQQRLLGSALAPRHIAEIGYDVAEALEYIHAHNVIHRDVKPSNILLVDYGDGAPRARAKLTDFGIALAEDVDRLTAENATTGTAAYLSPEQAGGAKVGFATDVYSLGLVLLECFTRTIEFPGTLVESAIARLSRDPVIPSTLAEHWREVLTAMTARNPDDRPGGRELVSLLKQAVIAENARHKDADGPLFPVDGSVFGDDVATSQDTFHNETLDRVTTMAARLFSAPISMVSVLDHEGPWFTTHLDPTVVRVTHETELADAAILHDASIVIEDCAEDPRTRDSVLVKGNPGVRFYVGVPLKRQDGVTIGTLCVLDIRPRTASPNEVENLQDLAALVVAQLEARREAPRTTGGIAAPLPSPVSAVDRN